MSHVTDHLELRTAALLQQQAETALESNRQLALLHLAQRSSSVQRALSNPQKSPISPTEIKPQARAPAFSTAVFIRTKSPSKFAKEPYKICKNSPTEIQPPACASPSCTAVFICTKSPRKSAKSPNQFRKKRLENPRKEPYRYAFANLRCALASGTAVYNCKMSPIKWAKEPSNDAKEPISNPQQ